MNWNAGFGEGGEVCSRGRIKTAWWWGLGEEQQLQHRDTCREAEELHTSVNAGGGASCSRCSSVPLRLCRVLRKPSGRRGSLLMPEASGPLILSLLLFCSLCGGSSRIWTGREVVLERRVRVTGSSLYISIQMNYWCCFELWPSRAAACCGFMNMKTSQIRFPTTFSCFHASFIPSCSKNRNIQIPAKFYTFQLIMRLKEEKFSFFTESQTQNFYFIVQVSGGLFSF